METTTAPSEPLRAAGRPRRWLRLPAVARRRMAALRPSERRPRTVWVVSFCPHEGRAAIGGFDWYPDWAEADASYETHVFDSAMCGGSHAVRLVPYRSGLDGDALTAEIDAELDLIEGGDLPAARKFIPGSPAPL